jgi:hypothetical protein
MRQQKYSAKTIKQAFDDAMTFTDMEIKLLSGKDKNKYKDIKLAVYSVIDHLYARLGLGSYEPYLEEAKVLREGEE